MNCYILAARTLASERLELLHLAAQLLCAAQLEVLAALDGQLLLVLALAALEAQHLREKIRGNCEAKGAGTLTIFFVVFDCFRKIGFVWPP